MRVDGAPAAAGGFFLDAGSHRVERGVILLAAQILRPDDLEGGSAVFCDYSLYKDNRVHSLGQRAPDECPAFGSTAEEDSALVAAILRKDRKATAEFVARYTDGIYGYVRARLAPRRDLAEDLVQEIFLAAWENLGQFRGSGSLRAWLMGIARHKVENHYRDCLRAPGSIDDQDYEPVAESAPEFHELLEQDELRKKTWLVMARLPENYRLALLWRYWDKASARDMALKTGKTEKAIERLLARARSEFRERWHGGQSS